MNKVLTSLVLFLSLCRTTRARECSSHLFYKPGRGCVKCPPCPAGMERTSNCGHDQSGNPTGAQCIACMPGTFKSTLSTARCLTCQNCKEEGKLIKKSCNATSNTICECPRGKYEQNSMCWQCSYCDADDWEKSKTVVAACKAQGMGRCSCESSSKAYDQSCQNIPTAPVSAPVSTTTSPVTTDAQKIETILPSIGTKTTAQTPLVGSQSRYPFVSLTPTRFKENSGPKAQQQESKSEENVLKDPGWIVAFSIVGAIIVFVVIIAWRHAGIRKKLSGMCCRDYQPLSPDLNPVLLTVEDRQEEPASVEPINNATPIPPGEQAVLQLLSSAEGELHKTSKSKEFEDKKLQCACTLYSSESSMEWLKSPSSSCEAIAGDQQNSIKAFVEGRQTSPSVTSLNLKTLCTTSTSSGVTSSCVTPPRVTSPSPSTLLSIAQTKSIEDQVTTNQSRECFPGTVVRSNSTQEFPDIELNKYGTKLGGNSSSHQSGGETPRFRNECSPSKETLGYDMRREAKLSREPSPIKETGTKKQELTPVPASEESADYVVVMTTGGKDIEVNGNGRVKKKKKQGEAPSLCKYRPILRDNEHRCANCCPQPSDSFFSLIERDRRCLKEDICKKLNSDTLGNYKQLAILSRVDNETPEFEADANPAERVLERIKAKQPGLTLEEFKEMLDKINRLDIVDLIDKHHTTCPLCKRNKFD